MQNQADKFAPNDRNDDSDGYYTFVSLIGLVVVMTSVIVLAFAIEMLA